MPCLMRVLEKNGWGEWKNHYAVLDDVIKGNISVLQVLRVGNSSVTGEFPSKRPVTRSSDVFCDLLLDKWLRKQSWGRWFERPSCSLWRLCNGLDVSTHSLVTQAFTVDSHSSPWGRAMMSIFSLKYYPYCHMCFTTYQAIYSIMTTSGCVILLEWEAQITKI